MKTTDALLLLALPLLGLAAAGCSFSHDTALPTPPVRQIGALPLETIVPATPTPSACLEGRALREVAAIDNDDQSEHGDLVTFAVAPDRRIGVAAADGTVKLWTLEGFVGEVSSGQFLYGPEQAQVPVLDLVFWDERLVLADEQGLVSAWTMDGGWTILGGGDPGVAIRAVALDVPHDRVAHASDALGAHVMVRGLSGATVFGPLETALTDVADLAFLPDGRLILAGGAADGARLELRDAADPNEVTARFARVGSALSEVARAEGLVFAAGPDFLGGFDSSLAARWEARLDDHAPHSVDAGGGLVVTIGAEGSLVAWSAEDGAALARVDVSDPITVRLDPVSGLILVGSRDGAVRAFACE